MESSFLLFLIGAAGILFSLLLQSDRIKIILPINKEHAGDGYKLFKNQRFKTSIEEFPVSLEIVQNGNLNAYVELLLKQHENSDRSVREYIARIPLTEQGQHIFRSLSVGWENSFSITFVAHKKFNGHHKILSARLSKEVTVSLLYRLLSPLNSLLGMPFSEGNQMETILTDINQKKNKETLENMMMLIIADNLATRYNNDVDISFVEK